MEPMRESGTPFLLIASALQEMFEVAGELSRAAASDRRRYIDERLRRLQAARIELIQWIEGLRSERGPPHR
jgi:hypothetical protein